jgi:gliding motility-associated-like protein
MKKVYRWILMGCVAILVLTGHARASHIVGGNIELTPEGGGLYTASVILYYDANSSDPNSEQNALTVSFFQKKDNSRISDLRLTRVSKEPLSFSNPGCAQSRNLKLFVVKFTGSIRLNQDEFKDPAGFYVTWERCCRSNEVSNLKNPGVSSLVLYAEFPAVTTANRSPVFKPLNGEILCRNTLYQFASAATDPDGDELRYRLETPFNSTRSPVNIDPLAPSTAGPYPKSEWAGGYGLTSVVPGNPALTLDSRTGNMSVTPTQTGVFVYRVVVEEFRHGRKIGEVHRDYQLLVIDCSSENPPPVALEESIYPPNTTVNTATSPIGVGICRGDTIFLKAEDNPQWAYQWQRDGINIEGATKPAISITREGVYSVVKTFANRCGNAQTKGDKFRVRFNNQQEVKITPGPKATTCDGMPLDLSLNLRGAGWAFSWYKNGNLLNGSVQNTLSGLTEGGTYVVRATSENTGCVTSDTVQLAISPLPAITLTTPSTMLCQGDSVRLQATQSSSLLYLWYQGNKPLPQPQTSSILIKDAGQYSVQVLDTITGCSQRSDTVRIQVTAVPRVLFDSIPALCGQADVRLPLTAIPAGGIFTGKGVDKLSFDARLAGPGTHQITYTYRVNSSCVATATRTALVLPAPRAMLGGNRVILQGDSIQLRSSVTEGALYEWSPPEGLSNPAVSQPMASPEQTTTYRLRVTMANECFAESEIIIEVLPPVKIPNGFTPNGDGTNDTWEIENSSAYPNMEVEVFNRWGNRVFQAKGYAASWDGRLDNKELPAATYYYIIRLHPDLPARNGSVSIFR